MSARSMNIRLSLTNEHDINGILTNIIVFYQNVTVYTEASQSFLISDNFTNMILGMVNITHFKKVQYILCNLFPIITFVYTMNEICKGGRRLFFYSSKIYVM